MKHFISRSLILFWFVLGLAHLPVSLVQAADNFEANLNSTYTINDLGNAQVIYNITLINNTPTLYVTQYAIKINSGSVSRVEVIYNNKVLTANVATINNETSIGITFPDKIVGKGQERRLQIKYQTPDLVEMTPTTLGITIPKLADPSAFAHYQVILKTPQKFGQAVRTSPTINDQEEEGSFIISHFNNLKGQGITAQFGKTQTYKIDLTYHLNNEGQSAGIGQIALPPDTSWQKLNYLDIQPRPKTIQTDQDGNWIASFLIQAQKDLEVTASATVKISLDQQPEVPIVKPLPAHLKALEYWESDNEKIKTIANQYQTPAEIYSFVLNTLSYSYPNDQTNPVRLGALLSLVNPDQAVCQEFTDLFIALARANKIPSRRLTGFAYTKNNKLKPSSLVDNVLHAWPEFFDINTNSWQQVDPTWEQTTGGADFYNQFDLNHIVFAINGASSTSPAPVGLTDTQNQAVKVTFASPTDDQTTIQNLRATLNPKTVSSLPIPGLLELSLLNPSGQALYKLQPILSSSELILENHDILSLLPFQSANLTVYVKPSCWFACGNHDLQLEVNGQTYQLTIPSTSRIWIFPGLLTLAIIGIIITLFTGSILVFKRKK